MVDVSRYGPWAVIAGGSEGVGAEFAWLVAKSGINLVLIARRPDPLEETAQRCRALGVEVRTMSVDLLDSQSVAQIAEATAELEVGLLIYNAGASTCNELFLDADLGDFQNVIDLNVTRMLGLVQHYGRSMVDRRRGGILIVGSLSGYMGAWRHTIYAGAKAFSRVFAESLWLELREHDVDVLELVLGVTRTPAMARVGLNFDAPGILVNEPAEVAAEGLARLSDGPVWVAGGNAARAEANSALDRARVVLESHEMIKALTAGAH
ncbi:short-chain dehydrogenase [Mycobacterium lehmannii]|uniref:Short-chain dehydrogenase n=1 Tax=Mycobacterium lehmannii TaxID=2048550 RepID=A0A117JM86_9MYCO|nr:SDR family NAD(P)-dependent oxidoreductase [Mycobacterium lehmannii]KUI21061.1 short-chain dehydrogenase [Mycobacterium lehmannii]